MSLSRQPNVPGSIASSVAVDDEFVYLMDVTSDTLLEVFR
jgi:hypothetical protein